MIIKTIILERIHKEGIKIFKSFSDVLEFYDRTKEEIYSKMRDYHIVIVKSTVKVEKKFLDHSVNLKVIARAGAGLDNIDLHEVKKRNVKIFSVQKAHSKASAEYTITLIFLLIKKIFKTREMIEKNDFSRHKINLEQLSSMTVGIIGMGNLVIDISKRLKNFGCKLISFDPYSRYKKKFSSLGGKVYLNLDSLLKKSDIIIMAAALNSLSENLINKKNINNIKKGSYLINCARARLIDQDALIEALDKKIINSVAIDIVDPEPIYKKKKQDLHPIIIHPRVFYSPHIAALTDDAQKKIGISLGKRVKRYMLMNS